MGRDFYDQYPIVKETIDRASQVLGYDLRYLIDTEEDKLNQTRYTQPAILATSVAIYRLLQEKGYQPDMVAGLSLGEYSALVASGALDFEDAVALVAKRGAYMEEAAPADSGKMVAVLNTPVEVIEEACQKLLNLEWLLQPTITHLHKSSLLEKWLQLIERLNFCKKQVPNA